MDKSYDLSAEFTEADGLFGEKVIEQEKDSKLKKAFQDLDDFMFGGQVGRQVIEYYLIRLG